MIAQLLTVFARSGTNCDHNFLGLVPWYHYLGNKVDSNCDIRNLTILPGPNSSTDVPLILAAIVDDLLRIAGIVAVAFVVIGAIRLITSNGDPEGVANARSTIINALIGLAIAMVAIAFVSFVGNKLGA